MQDFDNEQLSLRDAPSRAAPTAEIASPLVSRALKEGATHALDTDSVLHLQRTAGNASVSGLLGDEGDESPVSAFLAGSSGEPMDAGIRSNMEGALGQDFSGVRIHRGGKAAESAASVQAQAYTVGHNVVLGDNVDPGSASGQRTIAHELTHVVQQAAGPVDGEPAPGGIRLSNPADRFEQAAEATASAIVGGGADRASSASSVPGGGATAQRQEAGPEDESEEEPVQGSFTQRQAVPGAEEDDEEGETPPA